MAPNFLGEVTRLGIILEHLETRYELGMDTENSDSESSRVLGPEVISERPRTLDLGVNLSTWTQSVPELRLTLPSTSQLLFFDL